MTQNDREKNGHKKFNPLAIFTKMTGFFLNLWEKDSPETDETQFLDPEDVLKEIQGNGEEEPDNDNN